MARTWDSRRLRHERDMDARLIEELRQLGQAVGRVVLRYAQRQPPSNPPNALGGSGVVAPERIVPNTRQVRDALRGAIWREVVKPYFIGSGDEALEGTRPQSPYARLLVDGIRGAIQIQAERQVSIVERYVTDPVVRDWLMRPPPSPPQRIGGGTGLREMNPPQSPHSDGGKLRVVVSEQGPGDRERFWYDPFHLFVDPNGYRLSDRVWRTSIDVRTNIDRVLDYHIPLGTSAVEIAEIVEQYLTPGAALQVTKKPYGREGSYAARRLARTEITAAAGRATINASMANPFVEGLQWRLSPSHPKIDHCDENAAGGPEGDGVYDPASFPQYPDHPHCMCSCVPVVVKSPSKVVEQLRLDIEKNVPYVEELRGAFNLDWLVEALFNGDFAKTVLGGAGILG